MGGICSIVAVILCRGLLWWMKAAAAAAVVGKAMGAEKEATGMTEREAVAQEKQPNPFLGWTDLRAFDPDQLSSSPVRPQKVISPSFHLLLLLPEAE
jgi:hypothetical protein